MERRSPCQRKLSDELRTHEGCNSLLVTDRRLENICGNDIYVSKSIMLMN
jgi:hypothetical protein